MSTSSRFVCIEVRADDVEMAERAAAEAIEAGATGLEEREETVLLVYVPREKAAAVNEALARAGAGEIGAAVEVPDSNWAEAWKEHAQPVDVAPGLRVRPSFVAPGSAGSVELVIDPGQAFGTGGHSSTLLALQWLAALAPELSAEARVLDVGCGTGVLALSCLALGVERAVALDLDPLAGASAREHARVNGFEDRLDVVVGPLAALRPTPFDLVAANLLKTELLPLLPEIAGRVAFGGLVVLSGLLASELPEVMEAAAAVGLRRREVRERTDANGDCWVAPLTTLVTR